jgi:phosphohistidine phosphatase
MRTQPDHFYQQSAVVPVRLHQGRAEVCLIGSRKNKRWVIPKGVIEPDLSPPASAAKEALEEAGLEGEVDTTPIGTYRYEKWGGTCTVTVYCMRVRDIHDQWPESHRQRAWLAPSEAAERVDDPGLQRILADLPEWPCGLA